MPCSLGTPCASAAEPQRLRQEVGLGADGLARPGSKVTEQLLEGDVAEGSSSKPVTPLDRRSAALELHYSNDAMSSAQVRSRQTARRAHPEPIIDTNSSTRCQSPPDTQRLGPQHRLPRWWSTTDGGGIPCQQNSHLLTCAN